MKGGRTKKVTMKLVSTLFSLAFVAVVAVSVTSCGAENNTSAKGTRENPVKIGVVGASDTHWNVFKKVAEKEGVYVEIVDFATYDLPNQALYDEQIDVNEAQHIIYLANWNSKHSADLQPFASTAVYPFSFYGNADNGVMSLGDIKDGDSVLIPTDPTNSARGLLTLQALGLVKLKNGGTAFSTPADVIADESKVTVKQVENSIIPTALTDPKVAAAFVNNDFIKNLTNADREALLSKGFADDMSALEPYVNIWVSRSGDVNNEVYQKLAKIYKDDAVMDALAEDSGGVDNLKAVEYTTTKLQDILKKLKAELES